MWGGCSVGGLRRTDRGVLAVVRHLDVHQLPGRLQLHLHVEHVRGDVALRARRGEVGAQPGGTKRPREEKGGGGEIREV